MEPAGFHSKQTPLDARVASDKLPSSALAGAPEREQVHELQPEGEGPDVMMEPLRQHDPEERLRAIADAQMETEIAAARAHAEAVKNHGR
ncbi:hypothetical protein COHA_000089 [Chlorella ohadii]|uniref:Uncharacterized protein n=1 Tax=Chlorella ohadii TaxID=2649997 RepID=A0AAD5H999_9CHLO|nr:hypothetical protein COHA_000089 [Chlorella ohadii]